MTTAHPTGTLRLTCYAYPHGHSWRHVDLFLHDENGREINWVHWPAEDTGPDGADAATARAEPALRRTSPWEPGLTADGRTFWSASAAWEA